MRNIKDLAVPAVDKGDVWDLAEIFDTKRIGVDSGLENIVFVYGLGWNESNGVVDGLLGDFVVKLQAFGSAELFAVIKARQLDARRENNRSRNHRTS